MTPIDASVLVGLVKLYADSGSGVVLTAAVGVLVLCPVVAGAVVWLAVALVAAAAVVAGVVLPPGMMMPVPPDELVAGVVVAAMWSLQRL